MAIFVAAAVCAMAAAHAVTASHALIATHPVTAGAFSFAGHAISRMLNKHIFTFSELQALRHVSAAQTYAKQTHKYAYARLRIAVGFRLRTGQPTTHRQATDRHKTQDEARQRPRVDGTAARRPINSPTAWPAA